MLASAFRVLIFPIVVLLVAGCSKPDFKAIDGQAINLKDNQGRWLALNIWAEWCDPCREEIPELNALSKQGSIRVVGHDFDAEQGPALQEKVKDMGIDFPVIAENPLPAFAAKSPQVLPATYILSSDGKLVDTLYGPQTNEGIKLHVKKLQAQAKANG